MEYAAQVAVSIVSLAGVYALVAMGIQLIFGLTGIVHFAHGAMISLAAYIGYSMTAMAPNFILRMIVVVVLMGVVGYIVERLLFRPTLDAPVAGFVLSLGLILFLESLFAIVWGPFPILAKIPLRGTFSLFSIPVRLQDAVVVSVAAVSVATLYYAINRTKYGRAVRALSEDREMATLLGTPVTKIISIVFVVGTALAGLAGMLFSMSHPITPFLGSAFVIKGFAVAIVGGLGNVAGALTGAILLASAEQIGASYFATEWTQAYAFLLMIAVIIIRPTGLFKGTSGGEL